MTSNPDDAVAMLAAINGGANVNGRIKLGDTPLLIAARNGRVNVLTVLLDRGADVNARDNHGTTALMISASQEDDNDLKAVRLLIAKGADVNLKDNNGFTALSRSTLPEGHSSPNYLAIRRLLNKANARNSR